MDVRAAVLLAVLLCTSACGFHLRGSTPGARADIGAVYVSAAQNVPLESHLRRALEQSGNSVAEGRAGADLVLELVEQSESRRTVSFTDRARTAEYELTVALRYRVVGSDGRELVPERQIESRRTFRIDRDNLAASSQEETLLRAELGEDLVQQVMRSLQSAAHGPRAAKA